MHTFERCAIKILNMAFKNPKLKVLVEVLLIIGIITLIVLGIIFF